MRTDWQNQIRALAQTLSENGKREVSTQMLCTALGANDTPTKARVRRSVNHMVKHGEMERVRDGLFRYVFGKALAAQRYGEAYKRMWRIIRTEKAGWALYDVAGLARADHSTVGQYCRWLEREGFISRCGKKGNTILFKSTEKAREQRETPYPPVPSRDPFEKERNAVWRLVKVFMQPNPADSRDKIINECRAILARFEQEESHAE